MKRSVHFVATAATLAAAAIAWSPSAMAQGYGGYAAPPARGWTAETEFVPNGELISTGVVVLGGTYTASALAATMSRNPADKRLYVPLAGPWMDLAARADGERDSRSETVEKALLVADGVLQGVGTLQILGGFMFPTARTVAKPRGAEVHVMPSVGRINGIQASGTF